MATGSSSKFRYETWNKQSKQKATAQLVSYKFAAQRWYFEEAEWVI
jgi:hypothetical protein